MTVSSLSCSRRTPRACACATSRRMLGSRALCIDPVTRHSQKERHQFIQVRPRTTTKRVPSLTALLSRCVSQSMILVPPLLTCMAGTHSHAWQSCRARYGRAVMTVRALNSLHGSCGTGPFMHLRVRLVAHRRCGEAMVDRLLGQRGGYLSRIGACDGQ